MLHALQQDNGCQILGSSADLVLPVNSGREFLTNVLMYPDRRVYSGWVAIVLFVPLYLTRHTSLHSFFG
jgi:hypothetical protein